jgi:hypothetical protein
MSAGFRLAIAIAVMSLAGEAAGYVRSTSTTDGVPLRWLESCIAVQPDGRGSQDLPIDVVNDTLARAAANWSSRTDSCSYLRLTTLPAAGPIDVAPDGRPVMVFRDQLWERSGIAHDPGAIGLTTVFHISSPGQPGDGTILDADIELNGVNYTFVTEPSTTPARPGTEVADLENTLTHELGHVQGLAHTCWDHATETPPLDDQGNPIPDCDGTVPEAIQMTTMFPTAAPGEISKRMLSDDDVRGICEVYPSSEAPPACYQEVDGGCQAQPGAPAAPLWLLALAPLALVCRRKRA